MSELRLGFIPIARTTFDIPFAQAQVNQALEALQPHFDVTAPDTLITNMDEATQAAQQIAQAPIDLLVIFQATFADSTMIQTIISQIKDVFPLIWGVPEPHTGERLRLNSLCGINLAAHALKRDRLDFTYVFAKPDDPKAIRQIQTFARAGHIKQALNGSQFGRVGENPDGFETCIPDYERLQQTLGVKIVQFDLASDVFEPLKVVSSSTTDSILATLDKRVDGIQHDDSATRGTIGTYATLKNMAQAHHIEGFAVRCWPEFFTQAGCAACGALSLMNDDMIPTGCEADVNGAITQFILQKASNQAAFSTDIVSVDFERDALVIWHCGQAPLSMAEPDERPTATIHSNRKLALLMDFTLKAGEVTISRLNHTNGDYQLVIGKAQVIKAPKSFSGTSGLIQFDKPAQQILDTIMNEGLEHHVALTYGDVTQELMAFAKIAQIPVLRL